MVSQHFPYLMGLLKEKQNADRKKYKDGSGSIVPDTQDVSFIWVDKKIANTISLSFLSSVKQQLLWIQRGIELGARGLGEVCPDDDYLQGKHRGLCPRSQKTKVPVLLSDMNL